MDYLRDYPDCADCMIETEKLKVFAEVREYLDALRAGKDLFAEKPFGIDLAAARRIRAEAARLVASRMRLTPVRGTRTL